MFVNRIIQKQLDGCQKFVCMYLHDGISIWGDNLGLEKELSLLTVIHRGLHFIHTCWCLIPERFCLSWDICASMMAKTSVQQFPLVNDISLSTFNGWQTNKKQSMSPEPFLTEDLWTFSGPTVKQKIILFVCAASRMSFNLFNLVLPPRWRGCVQRLSRENSSSPDKYDSSAFSATEELDFAAK